MASDFTVADVLEGRNDVEQTVLLVLNTDVSVDLFHKLWVRSSYRIFADGASSRVFEMLGDARDSYIPDCIKGDFDSSVQSVLDYYAARGTQVVLDPDQYSTDFTKCLLMAKGLRVSSETTVLVLSAFSGRLDQSCSILHSLYKWEGVFERLVVLNADCLTCLLSRGKTRIALHSSEGPNCGILPLMPGTILRLEGFEWNVFNWTTSFVDKLSTSNHIVSDHVEVEIDVPMIWTIELRAF